MEGAQGLVVALELRAQAAQDAAAEGQVAQVVLEGGEACDHLPFDAERGDPVGDALLGLGNDLEDRAPQRLQGGAFGLLEVFQVLVDLFFHAPYAPRRQQPSARSCRDWWPARD